MEYELVVVHQFGDRKVGERITDAAEVEKILDSPQHRSVVKVTPELAEAPAEDAPKPGNAPLIEDKTKD